MLTVRRRRLNVVYLAAITTYSGSMLYGIRIQLWLDRRRMKVQWVPTMTLVTAVVGEETKSYVYQEAPYQVSFHNGQVGQTRRLLIEPSTITVLKLSPRRLYFRCATLFPPPGDYRGAWNSTPENLFRYEYAPPGDFQGGDFLLPHRLPRNSCRQVCCVFVARAASACKVPLKFFTNNLAVDVTCIACGVVVVCTLSSIKLSWVELSAQLLATFDLNGIAKRTFCNRN